MDTSQTPRWDAVLGGDLPQKYVDWEGTDWALRIRHALEYSSS